MSIIPTARLLILGGATLEGAQGPIGGRGAQRRRIALLALLATSPRPVSRDKLIGYLWQDADPDKARRLLSESVYVIRKTFGEEALLSAGNELRLNAEIIWSDVAEFGEFLQSGQDERAVALYAGPFLDGLFLKDASEFEHWLDRERDRLAREYGEALTRLATAAAAQQDYGAAAGWWRKLVDLDPYRPSAVLELMRALDASNERAAALQAARDHAERLHDDLEADPDPQVEAFANELRTAPPEESRSRIRPERAEVFSPPPRPSELHAEPAYTPLRLRRRYAVIAVSVLVSIAALTTWMIVISRGLGTKAAGPPAAATLAILPFSGAESTAELRNGIAQLLSTNLDGAGELNTVDPHALLNRFGKRRDDPLSPAEGVRIARRYDADMFVLGTVVRAGNQYTLAATLYAATQPDSVLGRGQVQGPEDSLFTMVDSLSKQLLTASGRVPGETLRRTAAGLTRSFPALKLFWTGDDHFLAGQYDSAVAAFSQAIAQDSNFALAYYRLSGAAEWNFEFARARAAAQRALQLGNRLPPQQQALLTPWIAFLQGRHQFAAQSYNNILTRDPHNVEARAGLAEVLVHYNPLRGQRADSARPHLERVLEQVPEYGEVRFHALELAAQSRDLVRFDSIASRLHPRNPQRIAFQAVRAALGTAAERQRVLAQLDGADEVAIGIAAGRVAAHTHAFAFARQITQKLTLSTRTTEWRAAAHLLLAQLALADSDWVGAQRELRRAEPLDRDWTRQLSALYLLHPFAHAAREQLIAEKKRLEDWPATRDNPSTSFFLGAHATIRGELRLYLLGLLSAATGDVADAESYRLQLARISREDEETRFAQSLSQSLRGHIAVARGDAAEGVRLLEAVELNARPEYLALSPFYSRAHDRFTIARLHEQLGNRAQATRWYESLLDGFDFVYAGAAQRALAGLRSQQPKPIP